MQTLRLTDRREDLAVLVERLEELGVLWDWSEDGLSAVNLVVEELLLNAIEHGGGGGGEGRRAVTVGAERGWPPMNRSHFDAMTGPGGSLTLGNPETVAKKILHLRDVLGIERYMLHISVGTLPHDQVLRTIELLGNEVAPLVRHA